MNLTVLGLGDQWEILSGQENKEKNASLGGVYPRGAQRDVY